MGLPLQSVRGNRGGGNPQRVKTQGIQPDPQPIFFPGQLCESCLIEEPRSGHRPYGLVLSSAPEDIACLPHLLQRRSSSGGVKGSGYLAQMMKKRPEKTSTKGVIISPGSRFRSCVLLDNLRCRRGPITGKLGIDGNSMYLIAPNNSTPLVEACR